MKKVGFFFSLLSCIILLTGCFDKNKENEEILNANIESSVIMEVSEMEYENGTGYLYTFTRPELGLKITTPELHEPYFREKTDDYFLFLSGDRILTKNPQQRTPDIVQIYKKNPNQSLIEVLEKKYSNSGCKIFERNFCRSDLFSGVKIGYIVGPDNSDLSDNTCQPDDDFSTINSYRLYIESQSNPQIYFKIIPKECNAGCSFIGKVEFINNENAEIALEKPEQSFTAIVSDPRFYSDTSMVSVIDPGTTKFPYGKTISMLKTGFERGDIVRIIFDGEVESPYSIDDVDITANICEVFSAEKIGTVKDEYFINRNNIPNELQYSGYQEFPHITSESAKCEHEGKIYDETIYSFTYDDLGIKISTPICWRIDFPEANQNNLFARNGVEIRKTGMEGRPPRMVEYIKIYAKDSDQSLEEIIKERHLNPGCKLESGIVIDAFKGINGTGYFIVHGIDEPTKCFPDDEDNYSIEGEAHIQFFEPESDKTRYYKVRFQNSPTIFGKIETL